MHSGNIPLDSCFCRLDILMQFQQLLAGRNPQLTVDVFVVVFKCVFFYIQPIQNFLCATAGQTEYGVVDRSSYYSFWGIDSLLGFAIKVFQNEMNLFTISPGIHYEMLSAEAQDSVFTYIFGLGLNIQDYISLNEKVFLMLGANILYDFVGFGLYNGESNSVDSNTFFVSPNVGMIFRL